MIIVSFLRRKVVGMQTDSFMIGARGNGGTAAPFFFFVFLFLVSEMSPFWERLSFTFPPLLAHSRSLSAENSSNSGVFTYMQQQQAHWNRRRGLMEANCEKNIHLRFYCNRSRQLHCTDNNTTYISYQLNGAPVSRSLFLRFILELISRVSEIHARLLNKSSLLISFFYFWDWFWEERKK